MLRNVDCAILIVPFEIHFTTTFKIFSQASIVTAVAQKKQQIGQRKMLMVDIRRTEQRRRPSKSHNGFYSSDYFVIKLSHTIRRRQATRLTIRTGFGYDRNGNFRSDFCRRSWF